MVVVCLLRLAKQSEKFAFAELQCKFCLRQFCLKFFLLNFLLSTQIPFESLITYNAVCKFRYLVYL
jgi:hypothetical protein